MIGYAELMQSRGKLRPAGVLVIRPDPELPADLYAVGLELLGRGVEPALEGRIVGSEK